MTCDCCNNEPSVGVASIPGMPMSIAWGRKCLESGAIPYWALVANSSGASDGSNTFAPWWEEIIDLTLNYFDISREQFYADVAEADEKEREYWQSLEEGAP